MPEQDFSIPAHGAYTDLDDLIGLRFGARNLQTGKRNRALSVLAGPNKSNFRGRGIDFEEVRGYQAGDDIRTIDWRVTARTGEAHTKLFREERERPVLFAVDQRNSMFFGSRHCFKSVLAAQLTSLLAWSALNNGDRVGGLVFNDVGHREFRPRRSRKTVLALLSEVHRYNGDLPATIGSHQESFADVLGQLRRIARPGSTLFLVSDFSGSDDPHAIEQLFQLAQHTEITALHCSDPLELSLPRGGRYAVTDGSRQAQLQTGSKRLRQRFAEEALQRQDSLSQQLRKLGIPLIPIGTDQPPLPTLQSYYGNQRR